MKLSIVELLLELKVYFNVRLVPKKVETPTDPHDNFTFWAWFEVSSRELVEDPYPIHYAANKEFNTPKLHPKMLPIIGRFLKDGADSFLTSTDEGDSILREHYEREGILEPFLSLPAAEIEA